MPGPGLGGGGGEPLTPPPAEPRTAPAPWVPGGLPRARRGEQGVGWPGLRPPLGPPRVACVVVNIRDEHNNMCKYLCAWRDSGLRVRLLLLFLKPRDSLPDGGGLDTDLGGSAPAPSPVWSISGTRMPLRQFGTAAHLHWLGFAPFFFLPVHT